MRHGAEIKRYECSADGCSNKVIKGGVCVRHGAKNKRCNIEGCTNKAQLGGVCKRHGAKTKCSSDGCKNHAKRRGVCKRHGAYEYRNKNDESTAFGSEFEQTTIARSQSNEHATGSPIIGQDVAQGVPEEVAILCQEIVEV